MSTDSPLGSRRFMEAIYTLRTWLLANQIPTQGVRIVLSFSSVDESIRALARALMELHMYSRYKDARIDIPFGELELFQISVRFESRGDK